MSKSLRGIFSLLLLTIGLAAANCVGGVTPGPASTALKNVKDTDAGARVTGQLDITNRICFPNDGGCMNSAAAGSGTTLRRTPPDQYDIAVWALNESPPDAGEFFLANSATATEYWPDGGCAIPGCPDASYALTYTQGKAKPGSLGVFDNGLFMDWTHSIGAEADTRVVHPQTAITFSVWVYPITRNSGGGTWNFVMGFQSGAGSVNHGFLITASGGSAGRLKSYLQYSAVNYSDCDGLGTITLMQWHFLAATWSAASGRFRVYQDAVKVCDLAAAYTEVYWPANKWTVASFNPVDGLVDDVRIANIERDATWVRQVYKTGVGLGDLP